MNEPDNPKRARARGATPRDSRGGDPHLERSASSSGPPDGLAEAERASKPRPQTDRTLRQQTAAARRGQHSTANKKRKKDRADRRLGGLHARSEDTKVVNIAVPGHIWQALHILAQAKTASLHDYVVKALEEHVLNVQSGWVAPPTIKRKRIVR